MIWSFIAILLACAAVVADFWEESSWFVGALNLIFVPLLLAGRHPG
jgi:hypothetical protein